MNDRMKTAIWKGLLILAMALGLISGILPGMAMTARAEDEMPALGDKVEIERVNGKWYVIGVSSTTVTLLAEHIITQNKEFMEGNSSPEIHYDGSTIKNYVEGLVNQGQLLARVKNVLASVALSEPPVSGAVPYLLSNKEAEAVIRINQDIMKDTDTWWLRSSGYSGAHFVNEDGTIYYMGNGNTSTRGVRPAIQLKREVVQYSSANNTFSLTMGHTHEFSYTVNGRTITAKCKQGCPVAYDVNPAQLELNVVPEVTYNGSAYTGATINAKDWAASGLKVPVIEYAGRGNTSYAKSKTAPTAAGTYTASITVADGKTATADFTINRQIVTINTATPKDRVFKKGDKTVEISEVGFLGENKTPLSLVKGKDYTATGEMDNDTAGDQKLVNVGVTLINKSYIFTDVDNTFTDTFSSPFTVNISKKPKPTIADVLVDHNHTQTSVSQSLAGKMPEDAGSLTYVPGTATTSGNVLVTSFWVKNEGTLTAVLSGGAAGNTVTLPVTIKSDNYIDADVKVIVTLLDDAGVSATNVPKIYGDPDFTLTGSVTKAGEGSGTWTWTSSDSSVLQVTGNGKTATVRILKAGTAAITARYRTNTTFGTWTTGSITVQKKPIIVRASAQTAHVGDALPSLAAPSVNKHFTVTGLVGKDQLKTAPKLEYQKNQSAITPNMAQMGEYDIVPSGADAGENYTIIYEKGTLKVLPQAAQDSPAKEESQAEPQSEVQETEPQAPAANDPAHAILMNSDLEVTWDCSKIQVEWGAVPGADTYEVYAAYNGDQPFEKVLTVHGQNAAMFSSIGGKDLDPKQSVKVYVAAYKNGVPLVQTNDAYSSGKKSRTTNVKRLKPVKKTYRLARGKSAKLKVKVIKESRRKKLPGKRYCAPLRYASSNENVATVTKKGRIKAVGAGTCEIWVYAQNGRSCRVKVVVKG